MSENDMASSFSISDFRKELNAGLKSATSLVDVADHFADMAKKLPLAGGQFSSIATLLDEGDKVLHSLDKALGVE